jgi:hypothetical protein
MHDLRRSSISRNDRAEISPHVARRIAGRSANDVHGDYRRIRLGNLREAARLRTDAERTGKADGEENRGMLEGRFS